MQFENKSVISFTIKISKINYELQINVEFMNAR
jgi:hypothetical protein